MLGTEHPRTALARVRRESTTLFREPVGTEPVTGGSFACRHCGLRHPKWAGAVTVVCLCRTGRPHLACAKH